MIDFNLSNILAKSARVSRDNHLSAPLSSPSTSQEPGSQSSGCTLGHTQNTQYVHSLYTRLSPHFHSCRFCSFNNKVSLMFDVVQVQPIQSPRDDQSTLAPAWFTSEAGCWLQCPGCSVTTHSAAEVEAEWRRSGGG